MELDKLQNDIISKNHEIRKLEMANETMSVTSEGDDSSTGMSRYRQVTQLQNMMAKQEEEFYQELKSNKETANRRIKDLNQELDTLTERVMSKTETIRDLERKLDE